MHRTFDDVLFDESVVDYLRTTSQADVDAAAASQQIALNEVWDMLIPVKPDCLSDLGDGLYEARWWKPVPMMDVEILVRTDHIDVQGHAYEPDTLADGLAVRFTLDPAPVRH
jgi:hypothetical protein